MTSALGALIMGGWEGMNPILHVTITPYNYSVNTGLFPQTAVHCNTFAV